MLGDVGGLYDGLRLIILILITPFSSHNYEKLVASKLYKQSTYSVVTDATTSDLAKECVSADSVLAQCLQAQKNIENR